MCCVIISVDVASNLLTKQPSEESDTPGSLYTSKESPSGMDSDNGRLFFSSSSCSYPSYPTSMIAVHISSDVFLSLMFNFDVLCVAAGSVAAYTGMEMLGMRVKNGNGGSGEPQRWGMADVDWKHHLVSSEY
ncbi:unnamed protein product [Schistocephalus solidus]|uniref:Transmembrane protein n=1 Tax=Schistocephalus solidus TaxID=70667 RepID=A0A183TNX4_SCHSO|nr:unnamed protein product [Schistocephalus solidus]